MKIKFCSQFIITSLLSLVAFADPRGEINFNYTKYTKYKEDQTNEVKSASFQVQDEYENSYFSLRTDIVGRANISEKDNSYIDLNEFSLSSDGFLFGERWTVGYQIYNWSKLESFHPANIINSNIIDGDLENFKKKGELSLQVKFDTSLGQFKLYYFPYFRENFYPMKKSRISNGVHPDVSYVATQSETSLENAQNQFGITWAHTIGDFDFMVFAINHIDRNSPLVGYHNYTYYPVLSKYVPSGSLAAYYAKALDVGITSTLFVSDHTLKLEAVSTKYDSSVTLLSTPGLTNFVDSTKLALGHEYSKSWAIGWDSTFFLEYQTIFASNGADIRQLSVFQNDVFIGHRISFNDISSREIRFGVFIDLDYTSEYLAFFSYEQRLNDMWKFKTSYRYFGLENPAPDKNGLYLLQSDHELSFLLTRYF